VLSPGMPVLSQSWSVTDWSSLAQGVGTIAGVIVALAFAVRELLSRGRDGRRSQAELVAAWYDATSTADGQGTLARIANGSPVPVYEAVVSLVLVRGAGPRTGGDLKGIEGHQHVIPVVPPGQWSIKFDTSWGGMMSFPGIELAFIDAAGRNWRRKADGHLVKLKSSPLLHYEIGELVPYAQLEERRWHLNERFDQSDDT